MYFSATQNAQRAARLPCDQMLRANPLIRNTEGASNHSKGGREGDRLEGNRTGPPITQQRDADLGSNPREEECHALIWRELKLKKYYGLYATCARAAVKCVRVRPHSHCLRTPEQARVKNFPAKDALADKIENYGVGRTRERGRKSERQTPPNFSRD